MMVLEEQIQEMIDKTDMVELVNEFVSLEKAGANYKGLCPFHNEDTPSFIVSPTKKIATCFGCNKTLDPIGFIKEIKNCTFIEACSFVGNKVGIKIDIKKNSNKPDFSKYYKIMEKASLFYKKNLFETKSGLEALDYLHKRGLNDETIKLFNIGLASDQKDIIYNILKDLNVQVLDMLDLGLVKSSKNNGEYYDLFTKRIMFPIYDVDSNIIGFSGRSYNSIDKNNPKYVNSPETIIFKKHINLFNLNNALPEIRKKHRVFLFEGQMDVISSYMAGIKESVCSLGTALTKEQCDLLKKHTQNVIICYDSDNAGINATYRAINLLKSRGLNVELVLLKNAKDPDEYINKFGFEAYKKFIEENIISIMEYQFISTVNSYNLKDISEIEKAKNIIFEFLSKENSNTLVENYLTRFSSLCNVSYSSLIADYNKHFNRSGISNIVENSVNDKKILKQNSNVLSSKYNTCKLRLFKYAYESKEKALLIDKKININSFDKAHKDMWIELIDGYYEYYNDFNEDKFLCLISDKKESFNTYISDKEELNNMILIDYSLDDLDKCINTFNELDIKLEIKRLDNLIYKESDSDKKLEYLNKKITLVKKLGIKK